jgi:hypothetical protein
VLLIDEALLWYVALVEMSGFARNWASAPTTRSSASCAKSDGVRASWALAAARLRHIAGTAWSIKNIELPKNQQMGDAITA